MKAKFFFLVFILTVGALFNLSGQDSLLIRSDTVSNNNTVLIINSFDAMSMKARKNKKELFADLADSLKQLLYNSIHYHHKTEATIFPGLLQETANSDSIIFSLMVNNNASTAIVIKKLDVHFDQTGVKVTGVKHNKTRIASYDICAEVTYSLYNRETKLKESEISICEFYTKRDVVSGLLAAGPDVVGKRKDAFKIIAKNAEKYLWEIIYEIK